MSFAKLISLFEDSQIMTFVTYFFLFNFSLIIIEIILDLFTSKERRWKDTGANIAIFIINQLLEKTIVGAVGIIGLMPFYWLTPLEIPLTIWTWVAAFFIADFTYYWMHRIEHEHRIL